jgi:hypothetical protein
MKKKTWSTLQLATLQHIKQNNVRWRT